jgi:hypothetical protein
VASDRLPLRAAEGALPAQSIVIAHLINPSEKYWGVLMGLDASGMVLTGINVSSFDEWARQVARGGRPALGLSTMFVPLFRVERIYLDDQVGEVESFAQRFERHVGVSVHRWLTRPRGDDDEVPS